jgi:YHS domain-containing protein
MIRFILYGILIYVGYRILKPWVVSFMKSSEDNAVASSEDTELIRDPHCGTYFLRQRGVEARIGGKKIYFCSEECRDKYLVAHREP